MTAFRPNQFHRGQRDRSFEPGAPVTRTLAGREVHLRPGLTFTPYANPRPCNAHCSFCSEELQRIDADRLTAKTTIDGHDRYFRALDRAWSELAGFEMGLSLSGLEATSDPEWLLRLLALVERHRSIFPSRVLYTNGSGLFSDTRLIPALKDFTGIELSRTHFGERLNHLVMRFDRDEPIRSSDAFAQTVRRIIAAKIPLKLVCILNAQAVSTIAHVEKYLDAAQALGVERVVFRELSELGSIYVENRTTRWIAKHRVSARTLIEQVPKEWTFEGMSNGYYYFNEIYRRGPIEVTLEAASYVAHDEAVKGGVLQKLVFHSTGDLCGDWVPNAQVIGNYFEP